MRSSVEVGKNSKIQRFRVKFEVETRVRLRSILTCRMPVCKAVAPLKLVEVFWLVEGVGGKVSWCEWSLLLSVLINMFNFSIFLRREDIRYALFSLSSSKKTMVFSSSIIVNCIICVLPSLCRSKFALTFVPYGTNKIGQVKQLNRNSRS